LSNNHDLYAEKIFLSYCNMDITLNINLNHSRNWLKLAQKANWSVAKLARQCDGKSATVSYAGMIRFWVEGKRTQIARFLKMSCPACGIYLRFDNCNLGKTISCSHGQKAITLRKSENLKMSCFFCQGHIEFPAHSIGTKMSCPHCDKDITLKDPA